MVWFSGASRAMPGTPGTQVGWAWEDGPGSLQRGQWEGAPSPREGGPRLGVWPRRGYVVGRGWVVGTFDDSAPALRPGCEDEAAHAAPHQPSGLKPGALRAFSLQLTRRGSQEL